jgi:hypothetical protein
MDPVRDTPEFNRILKQMEEKVRERHERIRASLEEKGLL